MGICLFRSAKRTLSPSGSIIAAKPKISFEELCSLNFDRARLRFASLGSGESPSKRGSSSFLRHMNVPGFNESILQVFLDLYHTYGQLLLMVYNVQ